MSDDVQDRLAARFDDEDSRDEEAGAAGGPSTSGGDQGVDAFDVANVKEAWSGTTVYLPDELDRRLSRTYKRTDLAFEEAFGEELQKTRYWYPLLVAVGLDRIEDMEPQEIRERMERIAREERNEGKERQERAEGEAGGGSP